MLRAGRDAQNTRVFFPTTGGRLDVAVGLSTCAMLKEAKSHPSNPAFILEIFFAKLKRGRPTTLCAKQKRKHPNLSTFAGTPLSIQFLNPCA